MSVRPTGLLDTNTVTLLAGLNPADLPSEPAISPITLAELSLGPLATDDRRKQAKRQARLQEAESSFDALPFDTASAHAFGCLAADLRRQGRRQRRAPTTLRSPRSRSRTTCRCIRATRATSTASAI